VRQGVVAIESDRADKAVMVAGRLAFGNDQRAVLDALNALVSGRRVIVALDQNVALGAQAQRGSASADLTVRRPRRVQCAPGRRTSRGFEDLEDARHQDDCARPLAALAPGKAQRLRAGREHAAARAVPIAGNPPARPVPADQEMRRLLSRAARLAAGHLWQCRGHFCRPLPMGARRMRDCRMRDWASARNSRARRPLPARGRAAPHCSFAGGLCVARLAMTCDVAKRNTCHLLS
jgi:hypothetical protein